jgi:hypothetical protein
MSSPRAARIPRKSAELAFPESAPYFEVSGMNSTADLPIGLGGDPAVEAQARKSVARAEALMQRTRWLIVLWYLVSVLAQGGMATCLTLLTVESFQVITIAVVAWLAFYLIFKYGAIAVRDVWRSTAYPYRHWTILNGVLPVAVVITLILGLLAGTSIDGAATFGVFLLVWHLYYNATGVYNSYHYVRVTPYFDSKVLASKIGWIDTYCSGQHLARHVLELDELARALGVTPLSEFGWNDDMCGEALVWHDSAIGLKSVNAILAHLHGEEFLDGEQIGVIDDLKRIADALSRTHQAGIRFCLILQHGDATNAMEHEQRKGSFF